jgi:ATP-binding cassette subfamily F protein 3
MGVVVLQNVMKQFGTQVVLDGVSLELHAGETVGLVGPNGAGKTTLFRLITRELQPDLGTVTVARGTEIGHLRQDPEISLERTLHDEVGAVFTELLALENRLHALSDEIAAKHDDPDLPRLMTEYDRLHTRFVAAGGHTFETRMNEILGGLGFSTQEYSRPMAVLSGGQRCRAALAKLLLEDKPFLLMDEPTNHLDIDAVRWLEKFLTGHHGGAVVISHDRYLLDRLCERIVEVAGRQVRSFPGNYTTSAQPKERLELTQAREYEKHAEFIAKERAYIAKHLAGQRSQQAKGRRTRLARRLDAGEFVTEAVRGTRKAGIRFEKREVETGGDAVVRVDELSMRFGEHALFDRLSFQVRPGERFGITGPNGTGKTTLLKIIMGLIVPSSGSVQLARKLRVGYYAQDAAVLEPSRSIVDEIRAARTDFSEQDARTCLGRFLFHGDDAFKLLGALSGGEQSRVRLATLILSAPDLLILDEPTNHLDIPSREALEEALLEFGGTVLAVSHDRYFLDRIVERLLVMRRESAKVYAGNYSYYVEEIERERARAQAQPRPAKKPKPGPAARAKAPAAAPSPYDRLSIEEIEGMLMDREVRLAGLHERFGDPAVCKDPDRLADLGEEVDALTAELEALDAAWQERADAE